VYISTMASPDATHCPRWEGVEKRPRSVIMVRTVLNEALWGSRSVQVGGRQCWGEGVSAGQGRQESECGAGGRVSRQSCV
jgi:hypothetical protein